MSFLSQPVSLFPIMPQRKIDTINVNVIMNEATTDKLTITQHPVQMGAMVSDHAFKEPTALSMQILQSFNSSISLSNLWQQFLTLQTSRTPFTVVTPKRVYANMLLASVNVTTDKSSENCLAVNLTFQEVIIVKTTTTTVPRAKQKNAAKTGKTEDAGDKSIILKAADGVKNALGIVS